MNYVNYREVKAFIAPINNYTYLVFLNIDKHLG
jgi:hypothetical protein